MVRTRKHFKSKKYKSGKYKSGKYKSKKTKKFRNKKHSKREKKVLGDKKVKGGNKVKGGEKVQAYENVPAGMPVSSGNKILGNFSPIFDKNLFGGNNCNKTTLHGDISHIGRFNETNVSTSKGIRRLSPP